MCYSQIRPSIRPTKQYNRSQIETFLRPPLHGPARELLTKGASTHSRRIPTLQFDGEQPVELILAVVCLVLVLSNVVLVAFVPFLFWRLFKLDGELKALDEVVNTLLNQVLPK